jgi:ferredoxin-NADP reductase
MSLQALVVANTQAGTDLRLIRLRLKDAADWTFQAGQFVILPVPQRPEDAKAPKGFYSIASSVAALPELELLVEHRPDGGYVSGWVSALAVGATVTVDGPLGHFGLAEAGEKGQAFLCTRAGLAPLRSMILSALAQGGGQPLWLFLGAPKTGERLLDAEWRALEQAEPRFHYRPSEEPVAALLETVAQRQGVRLYLAGFSRDVDPMKAALLAAGFGPDDIKAEKFG